MEEATIFAPSTAAGRAGLAVVRISGARAGLALARLAKRVEDWRPAARRATRVSLSDPAGGALLDEALAIWFPGPASFTGEDVAELHLHGSRAVLAGVVAALGRLPGLRLAEPGEFARRAFENDKLDLAEVEGLADLINAETEAQRRQALEQLGGALSGKVAVWRQRLTGLVARLEAAIDFPDEDLPAGLAAEVCAGAAELAGEIGEALADARRGERLRSGYEIAVLGPPNAGKSSLINALAKRDVAIVTPIAGTTRDVIEVSLDLAGYPVTLADTAGLRALEEESADLVEREGIRRALERAERADLRLVLFDVTSWPDPGPEVRRLAGPNSLLIASKCDLASLPSAASVSGCAVIAVSAVTGEGLGALIERLAEIVVDRLGGAEAALVTRERQRLALEACTDALHAATEDKEIALIAEDLRLALRALGRVVGMVDVEALLDVIFSEFCIGK